MSIWLSIVSFRLCLVPIWRWLVSTRLWLVSIRLCHASNRHCLVSIWLCLLSIRLCLVSIRLWLVSIRPWLLYFRLYVPVNADCPKLPSMPLAQPNYYWCTTQAQAVNHACIFVCPTGYSLEDDPNRNFFKFVCQANGTWSGKLHRCVGKLAQY